ncbi:conserved Plasmodium protein, unknown function [Plasmodium chabaudi chabaudi]|uniref:Transmembrane protein n=2 Tax=Plasmodium chabaudi TaxID=5825 RepID=A0A077TK53_PLACU|nr:conserved protein, unknown function [Plasmodium chabaudi chabaudi]SCM20425.1 conserved Plasmodium protein, unknown function [Plasmodium chabaudi adami]SCM21515.1 conserved Plasmodium protein, unknown function [Plasmodium chabaudi chabaudi]SCN59854.1 conserved Plasmodium protein, unknown function [Plasmodium chabaudi chabaudi]VTZ68504.1 conserved protein, unknown function [Plasmodium chabaudi chabaudi]|eukprot:XP_742606.2 conserved Plasmodium protein, unknown function [Plasmodium chabaudi chabaudi]
MESDESYESASSNGSDISTKTPQYENSSEDCYYNFFNEIFNLSVISYYFWTFVCYIIGGIIFISGYINFSLRIQEEIVCAASSNVYVFSIFWILIGIIYLIKCIGYSLAVDIENNQMYPGSSPLFIYILGLLCKTIPTIIRIIHIFNLFQLYVITLDMMILPECNSFPVRFILFIVHILWWAIVLFGIISRKRIFLPPHLYKPVTNEVGYFVHVNNYLHSFGL